MIFFYCLFESAKGFCLELHVNLKLNKVKEHLTEETNISYYCSYCSTLSIRLASIPPLYPPV